MKSRSYRGKSQLGGKKAAGAPWLYNPGRFLPGKLDRLHSHASGGNLFTRNLQEIIQPALWTLQIEIRLGESACSFMCIWSTQSSSQSFKESLQLGIEPLRNSVLINMHTIDAMSSAESLWSTDWIYRSRWELENSVFLFMCTNAKPAPLSRDRENVNQINSKITTSE